MGVGWDAAVLERVAAGCCAGPTGEDEFDTIAGLLGTIAVVTGVIPAGVPEYDGDVVSIEGWILGRAATAVLEDGGGGRVHRAGSRSSGD